MTKPRLSKKTRVVLILAILLIAAFVCFSVFGNFPSNIKAALIGACATVTAATAGAILIIWQIGEQARQTLVQSQHNEAMKLKLKVYEEVVDLCRIVSDAQSSFSSYVLSFQFNVQLSKSMPSSGQSWSIPDARVPILIQRKSALDEAIIRIIGFTERWRIIDPRIEIFGKAVSAAKTGIDKVYEDYFKIVVSIMPYEVPGHPGTLLPWKPPSDSISEQLKSLGNDFQSSLVTLISYIYDFQIEMQNLLLHELFGHTIQKRQPLDPNLIVVRLDRYEELKTHFKS